jgi:hypothetical protein
MKTSYRRAAIVGTGRRNARNTLRGKLSSSDFSDLNWLT